MPILPVLPLTLKFQSSSDRTSPRGEDFMIGDFIRRGRRGRAVSTEGLTSHRTPKKLCERDALPTELYPTMACKLARRKNSSSNPQDRGP